MREHSDSEGDIRLINAGFWAARALSSAVEVGLFAEMGEQKWTPADLAGACRIQARGAEVLLRFLAAFGFVEQIGEHFRQTPGARRLWSSEPSALRTEAPVAPDVWLAMEQLTNKLRAVNPPANEFFTRLGDKEIAGFTDTMEVQARRVAPALADALDLTGRRRLLDLGGGSGYLCHFLRDRFPALEAVVVDRPEVIAYSKEQRRHRGVRMIAGDFWATDPDLGHDVLLLSKVLHDWDDADALLLLRRWVGPMAIEGLIIVCEEMLTPTPSPDRQWASLLDVFLFAAIGRGRIRTQGQVQDLLMQANCDVVECTSLPEGSTMLLARVSSS